MYDNWKHIYREQSDVMLPLSVVKKKGVVANNYYNGKILCSTGTYLLEKN